MGLGVAAIAYDGSSKIYLYISISAEDDTLCMKYVSWR